MATIQTCHPYSHIETPYTNFDDAMQDNTGASSLPSYPNRAGWKLFIEMSLRVPDKIYNMPLFHAHTDGWATHTTFVYGNTQHFTYKTYFDSLPRTDGNRFIYGFMAATSSAFQMCAGFNIHPDYSMISNGLYRSTMELYYRSDSVVRDLINYDTMERFRMTTYTARDTNAFWFPNNEYCNAKILLTKVVNINDPTVIRYFPASFNYIPNELRGNSIDQSFFHLYDYQNAYIWNGSSFTLLYDAKQMQGGSSSSYILRPYILNEWHFVDIFTIEGGVPAYNTCGSIIRINDEDYLYLTNSFLLKITN